MKNLNIPYEITLVYFDHGTDLFPEVVNKKDLTKPLRNKVYNSVKSDNFNSDKSPFTSEKSGACEPTLGKSPPVLTGLPLNVIFAMFFYFISLVI